MNMNDSIYKKIKLPINKEEVKELRAGDNVLLTGIVYTARDAAHKRISETIEAAEAGSMAIWRNGRVAQKVVRYGSTHTTTVATGPTTLTHVSFGTSANVSHSTSQRQS